MGIISLYFGAFEVLIAFLLFSGTLNLIGRIGDWFDEKKELSFKKHEVLIDEPTPGLQNLVSLRADGSIMAFYDYDGRLMPFELFDEKQRDLLIRCLNNDIDTRLMAVPELPIERMWIVADQLEYIKDPVCKKRCWDIVCMQNEYYQPTFKQLIESLGTYVKQCKSIQTESRSYQI